MVVEEKTNARAIDAEKLRMILTKMTGVQVYTYGALISLRSKLGFNDDDFNEACDNMSLVLEEIFALIKEINADE